MANAARPDILRFMATYVTRKAHVALPFFLFPGEPYFLRIDDDHKITRIHMWRKNRFLFAAQQVRRLHGHLSQHLVLGVDDPPLARAFAENVFIGKKSTEITSDPTACQPIDW